MFFPPAPRRSFQCSPLLFSKEALVRSLIALLLSSVTLLWVACLAQAPLKPSPAGSPRSPYNVLIRACPIGAAWESVEMANALPFCCFSTRIRIPWRLAKMKEPPFIPPPTLALLIPSYSCLHRFLPQPPVAFEGCRPRARTHRERAPVKPPGRESASAEPWR